MSAAFLPRCLAGSRCFLEGTVGSLDTLKLINSAPDISLDHHQLSIILDVLGTPSIDDFYAITSQRSREYIRALPFRKKKPFSTLFPTANPLVSAHAACCLTVFTKLESAIAQALDLMEKCLTFSPKRRIDVDEALQHPYLQVSPAIKVAPPPAHRSK